MRKIPEKYRQWLLQELPQLEEGGTIDAETKENLKAYYQGKVTTRSNWATIAFATTGAIFISCGILLLFINKWEVIPPLARNILSFCPILLAAALSLFVIRKRRHDLNEIAGIFHSLAVGASIPLIAQTYPIPGNIPGFLLIWALLIAPLIFLFPSNGAYLVYISLISLWTVEFTNQPNERLALGFWILLIPAIIHVIRNCRQARHSQAALFSLWGLILLLLSNLQFTLLGEAGNSIWIIAYSGLVGLFGLLGLQYYPDANGWRNPLRLTGLISIIMLSYFFTWEHSWSVIDWQEHYFYNPEKFGTWSSLVITVALMLAWGISAIRAFKTPTLLSIAFSVFPILTTVGFFLVSVFDYPLASTLLFNGFMLALGIALLVQGCQAIQLRQVNLGMSILSLLIITRFFDSDFGILSKGIASILIGAIFIGINLLMGRSESLKKKKSLES